LYPGSLLVSEELTAKRRAQIKDGQTAAMAAWHKDPANKEKKSEISKRAIVKGALRWCSENKEQAKKIRRANGLLTGPANIEEAQKALAEHPEIRSNNGKRNQPFAAAALFGSEIAKENGRTLRQWHKDNPELSQEAREKSYRNQKHNNLYESPRHKDIWMRSRFETKFAFQFDRFGLSWEYEPLVYVEGKRRYPDFYVDEFGCYVEVRPFWLIDKKLMDKAAAIEKGGEAVIILSEYDLKYLSTLPADNKTWWLD
jgi:hypothetical protein